MHEEYCFHWSNTVGLMRAMEKTRHAHIAHMKFQLVGTHSSTERTEDSVSRMISELICQITINHHISTVDPSSLTSTFPAEKPCRTNQTSRTLMAPLLLHLLKQMQSYFKKHVYYSTGSLWISVHIQVFFWLQSVFYWHHRDIPFLYKPYSLKLCGESLLTPYGQDNGSSLFKLFIWVPLLMRGFSPKAAWVPLFINFSVLKKKKKKRTKKK